MECTLHLECTWSGIGVYFFWWVIRPSPWSGILVYTYNIRSVVGVYTPVGVVTELFWSQGKGFYAIICFRVPTDRVAVNGWRVLLQLGLYSLSGWTSYRKISWSPNPREFMDSSAAEMPVKFQSDTIIIISNLAASRLHEIWQKGVRPLWE